MGGKKKTKDKKRGKGAEKTAQKTEKKLLTKEKRKIKELGEEDIETILAQIEAEESKNLQVHEIITDAPSRRINFSFLSHPDKNELILYGGEYYNGQKTFIYKDLYFYNIDSQKWKLIKASNSPPPRCGHQMVATSMNKGQLWVFGGEYASPSQMQFHHYRDLWVYHLHDKRWEKVLAPNAPSARSGHRMVLNKKKLFVFGGFHDNLREYKYFNDTYIFDIENLKWTKLEPSGNCPGPRSGCCMVPLTEGKILIYGGYMREKVKKDVDKGHVYSDAFILSLTSKNSDKSEAKYVWQPIKLGGAYISPRCSMPIALAENNFAYCFGGVFDTTDDDEKLIGKFYNDLFCLNTDKLAWYLVTLNEEKKNELKCDEKRCLGEVTSSEKITLSNDGVFEVTCQLSNMEPNVSDANIKNNIKERPLKLQPSHRMNSGLAIKHGILYVYGGVYEEDDREIILQDFYSLDLRKLKEWKPLIIDDKKSAEWLGSDDSSSEEDDDSDSSESSVSD